MLELRSEQKLTQQELAARTGINRSDISKIVNGNANPSLKTMKRLAAAMGKRVHISLAATLSGDPTARVTPRYCSNLSESSGRANPAILGTLPTGAEGP